MSEIKVNTISKKTGNNVSLSDPLRLKSFTTTQRDALSGVANGDMIYNSTLNEGQVYANGQWKSFGLQEFTISYLIVAGGGGSGSAFGGGAGAGGYRNSYASETSGRNSSTETPLTIAKDVNYFVSVGAGGANTTGVDSAFAGIVSQGGGSSGVASGAGGSGAGGRANTVGPTGGSGVAGQGFDGGSGAQTNNAGAGGGGAGAQGTDNTSGGLAGNGGTGLASSITGSSVTRAGAGGGSIANLADGGTGGAGGGGVGHGGGTGGTGPEAGTANTGGGAGAVWNVTGVNGGSGVVILRWATADATLNATRTGLTDGGVQTDGSDSYVVFTAGAGNITFN